jgi:hypothetical protein
MATEYRRFHDGVQCRKIVIPTRKDSASPARTYKLGIGSESLSTARWIAFHQRS